MKHLYHLNWEKSVARNQDDHFKIISHTSSDEHKDFIRTIFEEGDLYELVATSETLDNEELYTATQNGVLSDSWSLNPPANLLPTADNFLIGKDGNKYGLRSTSVGDIIVSDEQMLVCSMIGFEIL